MDMHVWTTMTQLKMKEKITCTDCIRTAVAPLRNHPSLTQSRGTAMSTRLSIPTQQYGTRCTNSSSNTSCRSKSGTCLSCTQRRKLGSSTAARTPSSVVSGSSVAKQQPQAATRQSAAAATYRAARPRKQFWRASLRHCSAGRRPAILQTRQTQTHSSFMHMTTNNQSSTMLQIPRFKFYTHYEKH